MKTLHLLRHAKSSWREASLADHDRELNERGRRDAPRMGRALAKDLAPPQIYCSSALRARQTLEGLIDGWPAVLSIEPVIDSDLYTFDVEDLLAWLQELSYDGHQCLLLGHNPALTELCNALVGRRAIDNLPTAGYLKITLACERWMDVTGGLGTLETYLFPRDLINA
ncbi:MAG: histidine phosphatase family protein [Pseudomonadota bacterium]